MASSIEPVKFGEFFRKGKPKVVIPKVNTTGNIKPFDLVATELHSLMKAPYSITVDLIVAFLYYFAETMEETLTADWVSFGNVIGKSGDKVTPLSILQIEQKEGKPLPITAKTANEVSVNQAQGIFIATMFGYRLDQHLKNPKKNKYVSDLKHRASMVFAYQLQLSGATVFDGNLADCKRWIYNQNVKRLICAIDMFLCKFPANKNSQMRFVTQNSRSKEMTLLMDLSSLVFRQMQITFSQLYLYLWLPDLVDEVDRILDASEELDKQDSYVHYGMEFGASSKSPYSSQVNPNIHTWVHTIRVCLLDPRSQNARFFEGVNPDVIINAAYIGFALSHQAKFRLQIVGPDIDELDKYLHRVKMTDNYYRLKNLVKEFRLTKTATEDTDEFSLPETSLVLTQTKFKLETEVDGADRNEFNKMLDELELAYTFYKLKKLKLSKSIPESCPDSTQEAQEKSTSSRRITIKDLKFTEEELLKYSTKYVCGYNLCDYPNAWLALARLLKTDYLKEMRHFLCSRVKNLTNMRDKTMGSYLKTIWGHEQLFGSQK